MVRTREPTDAKTIVKEEGFDGIVPQDDDEDQRQIEKIPVQFWNSSSALFATIILRSAPHRAGRWRHEQGTVIRLAVISSTSGGSPPGPRGSARPERVATNPGESTGE